MKKKFFALMMAMVMVLSLAACGGDSSTTAGDSGAEDASGTSGTAFKGRRHRPPCPAARPSTAQH